MYCIVTESQHDIACVIWCHRLNEKDHLNYVDNGIWIYILKYNPKLEFQTAAAAAVPINNPLLIVHRASAMAFRLVRTTNSSHMNSALLSRFDPRHINTRRTQHTARVAFYRAIFQTVVSVECVRALTRKLLFNFRHGECCWWVSQWWECIHHCWLYVCDAVFVFSNIVYLIVFIVGLWSHRRAYNVHRTMAHGKHANTDWAHAHQTRLHHTQQQQYWPP